MQSRVIANIASWLVLLILAAVVPHSWTVAVFLVPLAAWSCFYALFLWHRTGLRFATAAAWCSCAFLVTWSVLWGRGTDLFSEPVLYVVLSLPFAVVGLLCRLIEKRKHPTEMAALEAVPGGKWWEPFPFWTLTRIPNLRESSSGGRTGGNLTSA